MPQALPQGSANLPRPASSRLPACLAVGRFQCLKIALEETQVWGSRREMSLRRAANSTPRHAGGGVQWAGNTPWRPAPVAPREPAQEPPRCCGCAAQEAGRGCVRWQEALPSPGLIRKVPSACASWGDTLLLLGCTLQGTGVQSWLALSWEQGASMDTGFYRLGPSGGPCLSPAAPRDVCGEGLSQPCPRHPL